MKFVPYEIGCRKPNFSLPHTEVYRGSVQIDLMSNTEVNTMLRYIGETLRFVPLVL